MHATFSLVSDNGIGYVSNTNTWGYVINAYLRSILAIFILEEKCVDPIQVGHCNMAQKVQMQFKHSTQNRIFSFFPWIDSLVSSTRQSHNSSQPIPMQQTRKMLSSVRHTSMSTDHILQDWLLFIFCIFAKA